MTTRLSSLQYPMLRMFADERRPQEFMSIETAQGFDQRPFRSMLYRGWVRYVRGRGFKITPEGREAWTEFENRSILRKNPELPLTSYFDPAAYHLRTGTNRDRTGSKPGSSREQTHSHQGAAA